MQSSFVDLTDANEGLDPRAPLFVVTRRRSSMVAQQGNGILYPDFTFFQWPESKCLGEESHSYTHILDVIAEESRKANTNGTWWEKKKDVMFWRGARLGGRRFVIEGSKLNHSRGVDIQFMFPGDPKSCVTLLEHCKYKYLPYFSGKTYSSRFKYNLLCGSCVFSAEVQWEEWWTSLFKPGKDYVEVGKNWTKAAAVLSEVRSSSDGGRAIAESGQKAAFDLLSTNAIYCYWNHLIHKASSILPFSAPLDFNQLPANFHPIEDMVFCDSNGCR